MKNNKKGFTLIELLAILIILAIISLVVIPEIKKSIDDARKSTYNNQVNTITKAATQYFMDCFKDIDEDGMVIYLDDILKNDYIENKELINPIDGGKMTGCVLVTLSSNQYHYQYISDLKTCQKYPNLNE